MKNPSYHTFTQVPAVNIPRSAFDMSSRYKTTFDSGKLVPCMSPIEILPGDSIDLSIRSFARLTTPVVPFMDSLVIDYQFFFVPNRLVWENFQKFMGERKNPGDSIDYQVPQVVAPDTGFAVHSVADYFGLPTGVAGISVNALPFRALNLIWNEFYRPELLVDSVEVDTSDGPDDYDDYKDLLPRFNRLDYFQGALPSPQQGDAVSVPLVQNNAPVIGNLPIIAYGPVNPGTGSAATSIQAGSPLLSGSDIVQAADASAITLQQYASSGFATSHALPLNFELPYTNSVYGFGSADNPTAFADLSQASLATINSLRMAFQVQLFLERANLGGCERYIEILRTMFGVVSPDARLQRPEFLGQGSIPIVISSVPQTSSSDSTSPQGNLAAFGLFKGSVPHIKKSFVEHGFVIGLMSVRSPITYQQGIDRFWSRKTRFDYYWPVFAHLGEQAVLNKEIFAQGTDDDDGVFGYQERFAEYRYGISHVTGKLRSSASGTLDYWHLGVNYESLPELGADFAKVNVPLDRVLAVDGEPQFVYDSFVNCHMFRPIPLYSIPGRIDHF